MAFVHLHNHTEYSMLDGAIKIKDMLDKAEKCGMQSIAITDHGNMFGAIDFYQAAEKRGIKPIFGCEFYLSPDSRKNRNYGRSDLKYYHLICLAENLHGYKNLMELSSIGYKEGFYYKPRIDKECLREHSKGLIGLSACVQGEIPYLLIHNSPEKARFALTEYLDIFGEGNFFLELQDHGLESERQAAPLLMELSRESGVPLAATNDMHYLDKEDFEAHESLLCIGTRTVLSDPNRMRFNSDQIYFKTEEEMRTVFPDNPEVFDITVKIAERCNVKLSSNLFWPEARKPPEFRTDQEYLRHLSYEGAKKKYSEITPEIKERLELELSIMDKMEASGYMLIVRDFISRAREIDVPVGPGRGSCVGSLVAYCLGITAVEPLRYSLLFERFLNPERQSMPDIDVDFADRDRQRVIDYVTKKYGRDAVCQIGTIGRMKAKAVIRDVGRVMEVPLPEVDKIAKLIDQKSDLAGSYNDSVEFRQLIDSSALYKKMFDISRRLEGLARQPGVHAAGVIIAPRPVVECAPVFVAHGKNGSEDTVASQYDGHFVEDVGLLKMDFLGLRNLTVIKDALFWIKKNYGKDIDMENVDLDDPDAYGLFSEGRTVGVFQFESPGMREYLKTLKPTCLEDLIAMCALYRPGPMDNIPSYINRKHGKEEPTYYHELLKPVLISTYGIFIYQEQVMQAAQVMAGYSLGQADLLRRAMGKKKIEAMKKHREMFIKGAAEKKIPESKAVEIFEVLEKFASYGFNKSHAAAYAFLAYQTAYLKTKYPQEFMAANMTSELQDNERITVLMDDCKKMGIDVLPPDINKSYHNFVPLPENKIMFGLAAIKNVGQGVTEEIIKERDDNGPYSSIFDFVLRMEGKMNRRTLESLIYS
ncbi:MAG: DNA polymerase III subunit alpha, partial [Fibrobacterota bacterium]